MIGKNLLTFCTVKLIYEIKAIDSYHFLTRFVANKYLMDSQEKKQVVSLCLICLSSPNLIVSDLNDMVNSKKLDRKGNKNEETFYRLREQDGENGENGGIHR